VEDRAALLKTGEDTSPRSPPPQVKGIVGLLTTSVGHRCFPASSARLEPIRPTLSDLERSGKVAGREPVGDRMLIWDSLQSAHGVLVSLSHLADDEHQDVCADENDGLWPLKDGPQSLADPPHAVDPSFASSWRDS
jgi:hypothetical protein